MIDIKYKKIYEKFIQNYKLIHVNPWHAISEEQLNIIVNDIVSKMNINNIYTFKYFIDYIIKRLSGLEDAHTKFQAVSILPINFRIINNTVFVNYPKSLKGSKLLSINGLEINKIIEELEDVITYGTNGKRIYELEKALFNSITLFGLPSLRDSDSLTFQILTIDNKKVTKTFKKNDEYSEDELFDYDKFLYGENATFKIEADCLIYNHTSVQPKFKEQIKKAINSMRQLDFTNIKRIIIDLRGNFGGNASLNKILIDFLLEHSDKELITLTDYRIFSGGRYALNDLVAIGSMTIGEEIGTPINCYGNSKWIDIDNYYFSISECYFHPVYNISVNSKDEYISKINSDVVKSYVFKPDIYIESKEDDFINGKDSLLEYAKSLDINQTKGR